MSDRLRQQVLDDLLLQGLDIVFCGTQAGRVSAERRAYYAGPGNRFWKILHKTRLTPAELAPQDFRLLPQYGIGLTDVAKMTSGPDTALRREHFDIDGFRARIEKAAPAVVAFNGKRAAAAALSLSGASLQYGPQAARIGASSVFVLPSTSGAANGYWDESHWFALSRRFRKREAP